MDFGIHGARGHPRTNPPKILRDNLSWGRGVMLYVDLQLLRVWAPSPQFVQGSFEQIGPFQKVEWNSDWRGRTGYQEF